VIRLVEDKIDKGPEGAKVAIAAHRNNVVNWLAELRGRDFLPDEGRTEGNPRSHTVSKSLASVAAVTANLEVLLAFAIAGGFDAQAVLNRAVENGMTEVVRLLLLCGARDLGDAVATATKNKHLEMLKLLREEGGADMAVNWKRAQR
jgi:hypothetical protein